MLNTFEETMATNENFTLEKIKVKERLEALEKSIEKLDDNVKKISTVLFGENGGDGVVHQLREINKFIKIISDVSVKMFYAILTYVVISGVPYFTELIATITKK